ncbi:MAG: DUF1549 domain-containing protein [Verrucomicrobiales bacterium]|nr:DUF1549 domain-containing protein [Verrucomicrobiales bacterium]MCP5559174.1 DUF1549 domain-containing protein [Verrucomicrobiaceae bacterium]
MLRICALLSLLLLSITVQSASAADAMALWTGKVQKIFDVQCVKCHGPLEQKSGLELDTPEMVLKGGENGAVVKPGKPEESALFVNLAAKGDPHMPPKKQLSDDDREAVREWIAAMKAEAPKPEAPKVARHFESGVQAIDTLIAEGWARAGVPPATAVDAATWCRRVYLELAGRIPTQAEVLEFTSKGANREALVDRLLTSNDYAVRMRELWDVFLMGRVKRGDPDGRRKGAGWWTFLEHAFKTNRPWNETVNDMLCARPENKPETKGASWFLYEQKSEHQRIAEVVAPVVYGTRIDCAQCHDHPLAREIKQAHYWGLVAAFNRSKNVEGSTAVGEAAVGGFMNFTNLKKESQPALVTLLNGPTLPETWPAGDKEEKDKDDNYVDPKAKVRVPKYSRREAFADVATHDNPLLARAFVNRMWAALIGRGIVNPPDQMNARNAPSHPELLDWLAADFAAHQYDTRLVVREIVLSRLYALGASDAAPEVFAGMRERPLTAEQIARSWRVALGLAPNDDGLRKSVISALPDVLPQDYNATFQQAMFLSGSPAMTSLFQSAKEGVIARIAALPDASSRVQEAFKSVYGRTPDGEETNQSVAFLNSRKDKPTEAIRDLLWALMTSAEFLSMP